LSIGRGVHLRIIEIEFTICAGVRLLLKTLLIESKSRRKGGLSFGCILVRKTPEHIISTTEQVTDTQSLTGATSHPIDNYWEF